MIPRSPYPFRQDVSLQSYNTFGTAAKAAYYLAIDDEKVLQEMAAAGFLRRHPLLILGGGSNLLFTGDYAGVVLHNRLRGITLVHEETDEVTVTVASGEVWDDLVAQAVANGWQGAENLSGIPGTVGAAAVQNIGAYGAEAGDLIRQVTGIDLTDGTKKTFSREECRFGYRSSIFKKTLPVPFFITAVTFRFFRRQPPLLTYPALQEALQGVTDPAPATIRRAVLRIRRSKLPDPAETGNAGSFFKNPSVTREKLEELRKKHPALPFHRGGDDTFKIPAAWLIEQCGWKGTRAGDCGTWPRQPLVIVNYGNATGSEIARFAGKIQKSVEERFGIHLEEEVIIL